MENIFYLYDSYSKFPIAEFLSNIEFKEGYTINSLNSKGILLYNISKNQALRADIISLGKDNNMNLMDFDSLIAKAKEKK